MDNLTNISDMRSIRAEENEVRSSRSASLITCLRQNSYPLPIAVFASSILVTLIFWQVLPQRFRVEENTDYVSSYKPLAQNILSGRGYIRPSDQTVATDNAPGFPLILVGVFKLAQWTGIPEEAGMAVLSAVGLALVSVFVFLLARTLWGRSRAIGAALLCMTYPLSLWLTLQPNTEIPFMVLLYAGLCLFWYALTRRPHANLLFSCGCLFGAAMLIRPIAVGLGLVMSVATWFILREVSRRRRMLLIAMLLMGNLVVVLPWEAFVYYKTGDIVMLSSNGVKSMRDGLTFGLTTKPKAYRETNVPPDVRMVMEDILSDVNELKTPGDIASIVSREFQSHPIAVTKLFLLKIARSWYGTDSGGRELQILLLQLAYIVPVSWGAWKAWRNGKPSRDFVMFTVLIVLYFWGMTLLAISIVRYMVPVTSLLAILIISGWAHRSDPDDKTGKEAI